MKIFFLKDDSLYKIFKTLQKLPLGKTIEVYIETGSPFFQHERWGKQIKELIQSTGADIVFATRSDGNRKYFQSLGLPTRYLKQRKITKMAHMLYLFFFNIRKFHLYMYEKKNYAFYLVFFFELCVVLFILYLLYGLVIPSTKIYVRPAYEIQDVVYNFRFYEKKDEQFPIYNSQLSIPYQTGVLKVSHTMMIALNDIMYVQRQAEGTVRIVNTTATPLPLKKGTELISDDGLLFTTQKLVTIPARSGSNAGYVTMPVLAEEFDTDNQPIGERGNIKKDTKLFIKKIKESFYRKEIYAEALYDFDGGQLVRKNEITSGDVASLRAKLSGYIEKNKLSLLKESLTKNDVVLPFIPVMEQGRSSFVYSSPLPGAATISGTLTEDIIYYYVAMDDVVRKFQQFLQERKSTEATIVDIRKDSLTFLETRETKGDNVFIVSTKISVVKGYDFTYDVNRYLPSIQKMVVGLPVQEAETKILEMYPEIATVQITITPPRYKTVSKLQSRIFFVIGKG